MKSSSRLPANGNKQKPSIINSITLDNKKKTTLVQGAVDKRMTKILVYFKFLSFS